MELFSAGALPPRLSPADFVVRAGRDAPDGGGSADGWRRTLIGAEGAQRGRRLGLGAWLARFQPPAEALRAHTPQAALAPPPAGPLLDRVPVVCGGARGAFLTREGVIEVSSPPPLPLRCLSPSEFEALGGRGEGAESWRRSIFVSNPPARSIALGTWLVANMAALPPPAAPSVPAASPAPKRQRSAWPRRRGTLRSDLQPA